MTREEAIKKLESLKISLPAAKDEIGEIIELIEYPWISVKDDLPCNHEELIYRWSSGFRTIKVLARYELKDEYKDTDENEDDYYSLEEMYGRSLKTMEWQIHPMFCVTHWKVIQGPLK